MQNDQNNYQQNRVDIRPENNDLNRQDPLEIRPEANDLDQENPLDDSQMSCGSQEFLEWILSPFKDEDCSGGHHSVEQPQNATDSAPEQRSRSLEDNGKINLQNLPRLFLEVLRQFRRNEQRAQAEEKSD